MEQYSGKFVYCADNADGLSFSLKGVMPVCCNSIDLPKQEHKTDFFFTLSGCFGVSSLEFVAGRLYSLSLSISDVLFCSAKRVLRRAVAGVRHFVCSNQRGMRRVAPLVPMALRL